MAATHGPPLVGERAPDFVLPDGSGQPTRFYGYVGGAPAVLVLTGGEQAAATAAHEALGGALDPGVTLHVVAGPGVEIPDAFVDDQGGLHSAYGIALDDGPTAFVLDPNVRIAEMVTADDPAALATTAARAVGDLLAVADWPARASRHAPVLFVPRALPTSLRDELIGRCATHGTVETGVEATADGARVEHTDVRRKRRRDHTVTDGELLRRLTSAVGRRVFPEVAKAFAYAATRFEGFKIACYEEEDRGFFDAHRDNLSASTAHRRFALTLNLNDDYEGGELCFPEYGRSLYRPEAGEALVFSGSHLHEVRPVTRGRRFVLLSFLFGEEAMSGRRG